MNKTLLKKICVYCSGAALLVTLFTRTGDILTIVTTPLPQNIRACITNKLTQEVYAQEACGAIPVSANGSVATWVKTDAAPARLQESKVFADWASGNLGVGTSSPVYGLDVNKASGNAIVSRLNDSNSGAVIQGILSPNTSFARAVLGHNVEWDNSANLWVLRNIGANDGTAIVIPNGGGFRFVQHSNSGSSQRTMTNDAFMNGTIMTLTQGGSLGIGTTNPSRRLDVEGGDIEFGSAATARLQSPDAVNPYVEISAGQTAGNAHGNGLILRRSLTNNNWGNIGLVSDTQMGFGVLQRVGDHASNTNVMLFDSDGNLSIRDNMLTAGRITLGNSQVNDWGTSVFDGRVWSANLNIHLSPPGGSYVYINDDYRAAGGSTAGAAGLIVEGIGSFGGNLTTSGNFSTSGIANIGNVGADFTGWNSSIMLNANDKSTISFHDAGFTVGSIAFQGSTGFIIGDNQGYGNHNVTVPAALNVGMGSTFTSGYSFRVGSGMSSMQGGICAGSSTYCSSDRLSWRDAYGYDLQVERNMIIRHVSSTGVGFRMPNNIDSWLRLVQGTQWGNYHNLAIAALFANGAVRFDIAEYTPVDPTEKLRIGELVMADTRHGVRLVRTKSAYAHGMVGIVSNANTASMVIGGDTKPEDAGLVDDRKPIALGGRVITLVSIENGPIRQGDEITSSSKPGIGMKARHGQFIGKALESFDGTTTNSPGVAAILEKLKSDRANEKLSDKEKESLDRVIAEIEYPLEPGTGRIITFVTSGYVDSPIENPDTVTIAKDTTVFGAEGIVKRASAFAQIIVGKLRAGRVEAETVHIGDTDVRKELERLKEENKRQQQMIDELKKQVEELQKDR